MVVSPDGDESLPLQGGGGGAVVHGEGDPSRGRCSGGPVAQPHVEPEPALPHGGADADRVDADVAGLEQRDRVPDAEEPVVPANGVEQDVLDLTSQLAAGGQRLQIGHLGHDARPVPTADEELVGLARGRRAEVDLPGRVAAEAPGGDLPAVEQHAALVLDPGEAQDGPAPAGRHGHRAPGPGSWETAGFSRGTARPLAERADEFRYRTTSAPGNGGRRRG